MAINIIVTIFIQALTYNFTNPDDGTCPNYQTADACLADPSTFDNSVPKCYWVPRRVGGKCHFREPEDTLAIVVFVAMFSAIVAIPFLVSMEWILKNVLSAKTKHTTASVKGSLYSNHLERAAKQADAEKNKNSAGTGDQLVPKSPGNVALASQSQGEEQPALHPALIRYAQSAVFAKRFGRLVD